MIKPQITSIHFQLTGRCNLRCIFCGQQNGMFGGCLKDREIPPQKWFEIADSLRGLSPKPEIVLWGGEPLLYEQFDELARHLHDSGFELGIITNGTLIDRHAELLNRCFKTIYISLDGDAPYHNRIRGKGVFERVAHNVSLLKNRSGRLIFLSTLADENVESAPELPLILGKLGPDLIHLQRLMYFTRAEIDEYRAWLRREFQTDDPTIEVWRREDDREYRNKLNSALAEVRRRAEAGEYPCPVFINPHGGEEHCLAPFRRHQVRRTRSLLHRLLRIRRGERSDNPADRHFPRGEGGALPPGNRRRGESALRALFVEKQPGLQTELIRISIK